MQDAGVRPRMGPPGLTGGDRGTTRGSQGYKIPEAPSDTGDGLGAPGHPGVSEATRGTGTVIRRLGLTKGDKARALGVPVAARNTGGPGSLRVREEKPCREEPVASGNRPADQGF